MAEFDVIGSYQERMPMPSGPVDPRQAVALTTEISSLVVRLAHGLRLDALSILLTWDENRQPQVAFRFDGDISGATPLGNLDEALGTERAD